MAPPEKTELCNGVRMDSLEDLRIAVAHDWLTGRAGGEKTFEQIAEAFPTADVYALTANPKIDWEFGGRKINTTFLDRRGVRERRSLTLPLMPAAWRLASRQEYDVVISSSVACVKGFYPGRSAVHLSYVHAPMRYVWEPDIDRRTRFEIPNSILNAFRNWDRTAAGWVDHFAANSTNTQERIERVYGRKSVVITPPVDTEFYRPAPQSPAGGYLLAASRFVGYKRLDLAIETAALLGRPLVVAGWGPGEEQLRALAKRIAPDLVTFEVRPSDERLRDLYRGADALLFPGIEDFGIVPVEAQACGTPVVAMNVGGTAETVLHKVTGMLVGSQSATALAYAVERLDSAGLSREDCVTNADRFGVDAFRKKIREWVNLAVVGGAEAPLERAA
jgi:glycosyltransferase involved in cell wall biosynthesis